MIALYARYSTEHQDADHQLRALREYAALKDWQPTEYVDKAISGAKESRPALNQLLRDVRERKVTVILVWAWDRLARSVKQLVNIFEECKALNVQIVSVSQAIDTSSPYGELVFHVLAAVAQLERAIIRERVRSGLRAAKSRGVRLGAKPVHDRGSILRLRVTGQSVRSIARELNIPRSSVGRIVEKQGVTVRSD